jgi:hypothetical protein
MRLEAVAAVTAFGSSRRFDDRLSSPPPPFSVSPASIQRLPCLRPSTPLSLSLSLPPSLPSAPRGAEGREGESPGVVTLGLLFWALVAAVPAASSGQQPGSLQALRVTVGNLGITDSRPRCRVRNERPQAPSVVPAPATLQPDTAAAIVTAALGAGLARQSTDRGARKASASALKSNG